MRFRLIIIILILYGFASSLHAEKIPALRITKDSLPTSLEYAWRFSPLDDPAMAGKDYQDESWRIIKNEIRNSRFLRDSVNGISWFRLHFTSDTSILNVPLALSMKHLAATEIYLDGKLIQSYGSIKDSANTIYYDPHEEPFIFIINDTGEHVLAIRHANFQAQKQTSVYHRNNVGFELRMATTDKLISYSIIKQVVLSDVTISFLCIFFVLSLLHFFLFLFYPTEKSNLFFSGFLLCLAILSFIGLINTLHHDPGTELKFDYFTNSFFCLAFIALSAFINDLFSKRMGPRFWFIFVLGIATIILRYTRFKFFSFGTIALIVLVSGEAVVLILMAIFKKIRGARIIGTGILLFSVFILVIFAIALIKQGAVDINDSTPGGRLIIVIAALAILSIPISMSVYLGWNFASINKTLKLQLVQVQDLSQKNLEHEQEKLRMVKEQNEMLELKVEERTLQLKNEKKKSDDLLLNILPEEVAEELKRTGGSEAKLYDHVTVLFTDFVNFTGISETLSPRALVDEIHHCFKAFDEIIGRNGLEKIKTIGDAYLAVCGLPNENNTHAINTINAAQEIIAYTKKRKEEGGPFEIRIGVNSGSVVAGIVGVKKYAYDIWGDTVNTAARLESNSESGKINISGPTYELVKDNFVCQYRGKIKVKNKGEIDMYFVSRSLSEGYVN